MSKLLASFDMYLDFNRRAYFTNCYDRLPSCIELALPMKGGKENMEAVVNCLHESGFMGTPIVKYWTTDDAKNPDSSKDYPYEYLWQAEKRNLLVWISLSHEELLLEFLYDLKDPELETWVLTTNHRFRSSFGEARTSTFNVLSRCNNGFFTQEVGTGDFKEIDINRMYNEDFAEVHAGVVQALANEGSGLFLFHGPPGTGKTSYIKHLIGKFPQTTFIFIQNEFVIELLKPEFVSFLLKHRNAVLIIEDAEKVIMSRAYSHEASVVSTILQLTDGLFSDYLNVKIICTFNTELDKIDSALMRKGRMLVNYEFTPLSPEKTARLTQEMGIDPVWDEMTLADIYRAKQKAYSPQAPQKKIGF